MGRGCESQAGQLGGLRPRRGEPAASYSRAGGSRTTLGEEALDFRVRDGNGYCRLSVATGEKVPGWHGNFGQDTLPRPRRGSPLLDEVGKKLSLTSD